MRVCVEPRGLHSRAMKRVAKALEKWAPDDVTIVHSWDECDLEVLHVIGASELHDAERAVAGGRRYAAIQYCLRSTELPGPSSWFGFWKMAAIVWSYYDLAKYAREVGFNFYFAPLGVDEIFRTCDTGSMNRNIALSIGYSNGPLAEAISEWVNAAAMTGYEVVHIGPRQIEHYDNQPSFLRPMEAISDGMMATLYQRSAWVSGLRHVEGFELPAAEALCCGARPIVFRRPEMTRWYEDAAVFVEELDGPDLEKTLISAMRSRDPVSKDEIEWARERFDWEPIATDFWKAVLR